MWSSLSTVFGWTDRTSGSRRSRGNRLLAMRAVNRDEVDRRVDQDTDEGHAPALTRTAFRSLALMPAR
jgi:hypothetical protein